MLYQLSYTPAGSKAGLYSDAVTNASDLMRAV
jgi:hypothetical protein